MNSPLDLHDAVSEGDTRRVAQILSLNRSSVNATNDDGETPLHAAVREGDSEITKMLLAAGADILAVDRDGDTPLTHAVIHGGCEVLPLLLGRIDEARLPARVLWDAIPSADQRTLELLIKAGIKLDSTDRLHRTPLQAACMLGRSADVIETLLRAGCNPAAPISEAYIQAEAAENAAREAYDSALRAQGAIIFHQLRWIPVCEHLDTPLHIVCRWPTGYRDSASVLLRAGANPNSKNVLGKTPLHVAAECSSDTTLIRLLAQAGANPRAADLLGRTPHVVAQQHHRELLWDLMMQRPIGEAP